MKYTVQWVDKFIKKIEMTSTRALMYCGEYLQSKLREEIRKDSYDTGNLARSITYRKVDDYTVEVGSALEYAAVREYGRKPGTFPNLDALVGWSARKGMITGGATQRYDDLYYKDKSTIFLIARAIANRGIEGKHTFENVFNREKQNILDLYTDLMKKW